MNTHKKNRIIEISVLLGGALIIIIVWVFFLTSSEQPNYKPDKVIELSLQGKLPIPYFVFAVDRSASMETAQSDPDNFENESLKQILRLLYRNGKYLFETTGFYPRIKLISFSGSPENITPSNDWFILNSDEKISRLDSLIDKNLSERDGQFTDINAVADNILDIYSTIPPSLKNTDIERPTSLIAMILTDGEIYPNFYNKINSKSEQDHISFVKEVQSYVSSTYGEQASKSLIEYTNKSKYLDPIEWAKRNLNDVQYKSFLSYFYHLNEVYGIKNKQKMEYAKFDLQEKLKSEFGKLNSPSTRINVIGLLKGDGRIGEEEYLKNWATGLGFYYRIEEAKNLGKVFADLISEHLSSYTERFSLSDEKLLNPFSREVMAAQISVVFPGKIDNNNKSNLIKVFSPEGKTVTGIKDSKLNYSELFYLHNSKFGDFYKSPGWKIKFNPVKLENNTFVEKVECIVSLIQGIVLDVNLDTSFVSDSNITRYLVRLVDLNKNSIVEWDSFEQIPEFNIEVLDEISFQPKLQINNKYEQNAAVVDFIDWQPGTYSIIFRMNGGKLKGDYSNLSPRSLTTDIDIGEMVWFVNSEGERIKSLRLDNLDRK